MINIEVKTAEEAATDGWLSLDVSPLSGLHPTYDNLQSESDNPLGKAIALNFNDYDFSVTFASQYENDIIYSSNYGFEQ